MSVKIVVQVILNWKRLAGVFETAAKGHAIALPLNGVQSFATVVNLLPRHYLCQYIWLVIIAKKQLWKPM